MESQFNLANLSLMMASGSTNPNTVRQLNPGSQPIYQEATLIQGNQPAIDTMALLTSGKLQGVSQTVDHGQTNAEALQVLAQLGRVMKEKVNSSLGTLQGTQTGSVGVGATLPIGLRSNTGLMGADSSNYLSTISTPLVQASIPQSVVAPAPTVLELLTGQLGPLTTQQSSSRTNEAQGRVGQAAEVVDYLHGQVKSGIPMSSVPASGDQQTISSLLPVSSTASVSNLLLQQQQQQFLSNAVPASRDQQTISSLLPIGSTASVSSLLPLGSIASVSNLPQQQQFLSNAFSPVVTNSMTDSPIVNLMGNADMMMGQGNVVVSNRSRKRQLERDNLNASPDTFHHGKQRKATEEKNPNRFYLRGIQGLTQMDVCQYFSQFGNIVDCNILSHKKFGFLEFDQLSHNQQMNVLGKHTINNVLVIVERSKAVGSGKNETVSSERKTSKPEKNYRFYIGGIQGLTQMDVCQYFSQFGNIVDCNVLSHNKFSFLEFNQLSHNQEMNVLGNHNINNVLVTVARSKALGSGNNHRFFVGNTIGLRSEDLRQYFSRFGSLAESTLNPRKGDHRTDPSFGFVVFKNINQDTIQRLIGQHTIDGIHVNVKMAKPQKMKETTQNTGGPLHSVEKVAEKINQHIKSSTKNPNRFYIGGTKGLTQMDVCQYFSQFGNIVDFKVMSHNKFCFLEFDQLSHNQQMNVLGNHTINNVLVTVESSKAPGSGKNEPVLSERMISKPEKNLNRFYLRGILGLTQMDVCQYFSQFGNIVDCNVMSRNKFGFLEFDQLSHNQQMNMLGKHTINNVVVIVERSKALGSGKNEPVSSERMTSKPENRDPNKYRFFVGNTIGLRPEDLQQYFSRFGPLVESTLKPRMGDHKTDPSFAFVEFKYINQDTIQRLIGQHTIDGIHVIVQMAKPQKMKETTQNTRGPLHLVEKAAEKINQHIKSSTLYVNGLDAYSKDDLMIYFSQYGQITDIDIPVNDRKSMSYGFIHFRSPSQVEAAFQDGQPIEQDGDKTRHYFKKSYVDVAHSNAEKSEKNKNTTEAKSSLAVKRKQNPNDASTLYVGNLDTNQVSKDTFLSYFSQFGKIESIDVIESKRYGFVTYQFPGQAEAAYRAGAFGHGNKSRHFIGNASVHVALRK